jgi:3-oxoacyl-[acyl-carrier protein] reductase
VDLGLAGRTAVVCGGSRGIGFATAVELLGAGAEVLICGRDAAALDSARRIAGSPDELHTVVADLSTGDGLSHMVDETARVLGHADVLITNTGGPPTMPALDVTWATWEQAIGLLLRSAVEMTRALVPGMQERKWGRVIGITSLAVKRPVANLVLSNALRAAVTGYYRTLANEVAADGVTVNTVLPGYTETDRLTALADANARRTGSSSAAVYQRWIAETPAGRLGQPDELAAVIAFLASNRAGFVTGQAICVDGGATGTLL